jgi:ribonuclease D
MQVVREVAAAMGVGPEVLATRRDVEALAFSPGALDSSPLLRGWRREVVGARLQAVLARK